MCRCLCTFYTNYVCLKAPTYKLAKILVSFFEPLTTNKYTVKICLTLSLKLLSKFPATSWVALTLIHFFANIPLETTQICTNELFKKKDIVRDFKKSEI